MNILKMTILAENLQYVQEKVQHFNKKASKLNKIEVTLTHSNMYIDSTDTQNIKEVIDIEIRQQEEIVIAGYKVVAKIDRTYPSKNFVVTYSNITKEQVGEWQHLDSNCEHCNTHRQRNVTYILQNVKTNKYIQVGKNCLKDFLGHNIHATLVYYDLLQELDIQIHNIPNSKKCNTRFYKTLDVLNLIDKEINAHGYYSSNECWHTELKTTGTRVKETIVKIQKFATIDTNKEQELKEVVNYIINYDINKEKDESRQEFYKKLQNILKCDYCKYLDIPLLAPVFVIVDILKDKEAKELAKAKSKYMYNIKDRIEIKLTKENIFGYDTQYGYMHISVYKDEKGNTYKWCSSNFLDMEDDKWYTVKATVKAYEEYKGEKQTVLTRCKIQQNDEESYEQNKNIESKTLLDDKIGEYNIQMISNIHLENLVESCTYLKITTSKNDLIYYNLCNCPFFDFKYKQGIKGITKIKKFIENDIYEYLEKKLNCDNLEYYARKTTRQLIKQYL